MSNSGLSPIEKCNGEAQHAFYELKGLKFEANERFQGKWDRQGKVNVNDLLLNTNVKFKNLG